MHNLLLASSGGFPRWAMITIIVAIVLIIAVIILFTSAKVVEQAEQYVIERLGQYNRTWTNGLKFKWPFVEQIRNKISLKEQIYDIPPQGIISKDNVTLQIDAIVYWRVTDAKMITYQIANPIKALGNLTQTILRNICGDMTIEEMLTSRATINNLLSKELDEATDPWGIKVTRVEIKNILLPEDVRKNMERQMVAERTKRATILEAEGSRQAAILEAEGFKSSAILHAEGKKRSAILEAEAEAQKILIEADAQAKQVEINAKAQAVYYTTLNGSKPTQETLAIKQLESLIEVSKSPSNKIFIPSNLTEAATVGTAWAAGRDLISKEEK